MNSATIVQKLWNYCNILRDDGLSYGDYPLTVLRTGSEQEAPSPITPPPNSLPQGEGSKWRRVGKQSRPPFSRSSVHCVRNSSPGG